MPARAGLDCTTGPILDVPELESAAGSASRGSPTAPQVIRQRFNRLAARAGLPRIRLHGLRHSYATAALKANINPKIVSQRLGRASVGFTLGVYSHALPGIDRDAATTMARLVLGDDLGVTLDTTDETIDLTSEDP